MLKNKKDIIWILLPIPGWKKVLLYELLLITRVYIFIKNSNPRFPHFFNVKHQNRREWYNLITHHEVVYNHLPGKSHRIFEFLWVNTMENNFVVCKSTWRQKQRRQKKKQQMRASTSPSKCIGTDSSSTVAASIEKRPAASLTNVIILVSAPGISNPSRRTPIRRLEMSPVSYTWEK